MYYNGNKYLEDDVAKEMGKEVLKVAGYFPVVDVAYTFSFPIERLVMGQPEFDGYAFYIRHHRAEQNNMAELKSLMPTLRQNLTELFTRVFAEIDTRSPRSARGVIISLVDGTFPNEAVQDLTPEQQQRIIDVGIMWELEEVAQVNRDMQTELLALEITEDMTLEQAQEITLRIANAKPWLPWRE